MLKRLRIWWLKFCLWLNAIEIESGQDLLAYDKKKKAKLEARLKAARHG